MGDAVIPHRLVLTPSVVALLEPLGVPYSWGAGALRDGLAGWPAGVPGVGGGVGYDCSGYAQLALLRLGIVRPDAWEDLRAVDLANASNPLAAELAEPGDLVFYASPLNHVMVALGCGMVVGAAGGGSHTNADSASACVQVRPLHYRADLVTVGRLKAQYRRADA